MPKKDRHKKTYDLDPRLTEIIDDLSIEYGVPKSQIAGLFIALGAVEFFSKKVNLLGRLRRSDSPAYQHDLDIEDLIERVRRSLE